ncbi:MAG: NTP transferase domain-containing protein [Magnetococcales bacterium]|nr:NTP transferase domain-containing protein [Magnetococcales bacterium]
MVTTPDPLPLHAIDVVLLAGGLGTRLRSELPDRQKVLADVNGQPFLAQLLAWVQRHGARRVILALGYRSEQVTNCLTQQPWHRQGLEIVASVEPEPRGTAGALSHALPWLRTDTVLVMNGDSFAPIDLYLLSSLHNTKKASITLGVCSVTDTSRFGAVTVNDDDEVTAFLEKPAATIITSPTAGTISAGIYLMSYSVIAAIPTNQMVSLERDVFPGYIRRGLFASRQQVPFIDIGTPASYAQRHQFFAD